MFSIIKIREEDKKIYLLGFAFVVFNALLVHYEIFYLPAVPFLLLAAWLLINRLDRFLYLIVFFVPLSIPLTYLAGRHLGVDLFLPTEPMLAIVLLLFFLKYLRGNKLDIRFLRHPVTLAIYFNLAWILITSITSTMPLVSFKFLVARTWFFIAFYFIASAVFSDKARIRYYLWAYLVPFTAVIIYSLVRHSSRGILNQMAAHSVVQPFYNDHTAYGMALGMLVPVLIGLFIGNFGRLSLPGRVLFFLYIVLFLAATIFSYTRATWVSLVGIAGIWILILLKIRWQYFVGGVVIVFSLFLTFQTELMIKLEGNKQTSSGKFAEHIQSIANVQTDASNLERLNRWSCAIRMFKEKPLFGWGPGTYMFQYAPFQNSWEKTSISTNAHTRGNAHSEYLGPLSEQGIPGLLSMLVIIFLTLGTGIRVYYRSKNKQVKILALSVLLGLVSYYIHGILNNFLDSDKASALFWGFTAILVVLDLKYTGKESGSKDLNTQDRDIIKNS